MFAKKVQYTFSRCKFSTYFRVEIKQRYLCFAILSLIPLRDGRISSRTLSEIYLKIVNLLRSVGMSIQAKRVPTGYHTSSSDSSGLRLSMIPNRPFVIQKLVCEKSVDFVFL